MIENALVEGSKIDWVKPKTVDSGVNQDGNICANLSNPAQMKYLGSTQTQPRGGIFRRAPKIYRMPVNSLIPHKWLDYMTGRTACIDQATDVLTGWMSGCLIARGTYNGKMSVFHLGTVMDTTVNNLVKDTFRTQLSANATGFYPHAAWSFAERKATGKATDILALVTSAGSFYSILIAHDSKNPRKLHHVAGIKKVPPLNRATLLNRLQ